nr:hypothetical protein Iba_chr12eCG9380 [Ipomoea batatas]
MKLSSYELQSSSSSSSDTKPSEDTLRSQTSSFGNFIIAIKSAPTHLDSRASLAEIRGTGETRTFPRSSTVTSSESNRERWVWEFFPVNSFTEFITSTVVFAGSLSFSDNSLSQSSSDNLLILILQKLKLVDQVKRQENHKYRWQKDINSSFMFPSCPPHALSHSQRGDIRIKTYDQINFHYIQTFFCNRGCNNDIVHASSKFLLATV